MGTQYIHLGKGGVQKHRGGGGDAQRTVYQPTVWSWKEAHTDGRGRIPIPWRSRRIRPTVTYRLPTVNRQNVCVCGDAIDSLGEGWCSKTPVWRGCTANCVSADGLVVEGGPLLGEVGAFLFLLGVLLGVADALLSY